MAHSACHISGNTSASATGTKSGTYSATGVQALLVPTLLALQVPHLVPGTSGTINGAGTFSANSATTIFNNNSGTNSATTISMNISGSIIATNNIIHTNISHNITATNNNSTKIRNTGPWPVGPGGARCSAAAAVLILLVIIM